MDEYMAALQIKYIRAVLDKTLNAKSEIKIQKKYTPGQFQDWKEDAKTFASAAKEHLESLGLDPKEFLPVLVDAHRVQQVEMPKPKVLVEHDDFLPLNTETWNPTQISQ
jgi:uncharacterized protein YhaN